MVIADKQLEDASGSGEGPGAALREEASVIAPLLRLVATTCTCASRRYRPVHRHARPRRVIINFGFYGANEESRNSSVDGERDRKSGWPSTPRLQHSSSLERESLDSLELIEQRSIHPRKLDSVQGFAERLLERKYDQEILSTPTHRCRRPMAALETAAFRVRLLSGRRRWWSLSDRTPTPSSHTPTPRHHQRSVRAARARSRLISRTTTLGSDSHPETYLRSLS